MSTTNIFSLETLPKTEENTTYAERKNISNSIKFDNDCVIAKQRFMKASEMIDYIHTLIEKHGDKPLFINSEDIGFIVSINNHCQHREVIPPYEEDGNGRFQRSKNSDVLDAIVLEIGTNYSYTV